MADTLKIVSVIQSVLLCALSVSASASPSPYLHSLRLPPLAPSFFLSLSLSFFFSFLSYSISPSLTLSTLISDNTHTLTVIAKYTHTHKHSTTTNNPDHKSSIEILPTIQQYDMPCDIHHNPLKGVIFTLFLFFLLKGKYNSKV